MSHVLVPLNRVKPNPFRLLDHYPLNENKVAALERSITRNGWWKNVLARKTADGDYELAHGHHRLAALQRLAKQDAQWRSIDLIVEPLDDAAMLRCMADENNAEDYGTTFAHVHSVVRAVVDQYAKGVIALDAVPKDTPAAYTRVAPSFKTGGPVRPDRTRTYTPNTVGAFLGWVQPSGRAQEKVADALNALELVELGVLAERDLDRLNIVQARDLCAATRHAMEQDRANAERAARQAELERQTAEEQRVAAAKAAESAASAKEALTLANKLARAEQDAHHKAEAEAKKAKDAATRKAAEQAAKRAEHAATVARDEATTASAQLKRAERAAQQATHAATQAEAKAEAKRTQAHTHIAKAVLAAKTVAAKVVAPQPKVKSKRVPMPVTDLTLIRTMLDDADDLVEGLKTLRSNGALSAKAATPWLRALAEFRTWLMQEVKRPKKKA